ncbi:acyltransferase [Peribacillus frigoritolerans]|uniref:acyltransferase n=1 Tax=Peribacillus frigoritolerans TaxID=450367 RepID=UPI0021CFC620|nr:acyltransferase [Peribacillus frigoritolerans]MCU6600465.1 acyltransferase [Peribacillus frigoritolerans]
MYKIISLFLSLPKTIYFNLRYFGIKMGLKLPVLVSHQVHLKALNGQLLIENPTRFGVRIGFGDVGIFDKQKSRGIWQVNGKVVFMGKSHLGHGAKISVGKNGVLKFGDNFTITAESSIICNKSISFGKETLISWENLIMDTDFHTINDADGNKINHDGSIHIGNHVWIGSRCTILKGAQIPDETVIASNSVITRKYSGNNLVIGGNPPKVLKENITWIM